jgi:hypothetical protein
MLQYHCYILNSILHEFLHVRYTNYPYEIAWYNHITLLKYLIKKH